MILFAIRIPKVFSLLISGALLSVAGYRIQHVVLNPLADPYLLGTSVGASLGLAIHYIFLVVFSFFLVCYFPLLEHYWPPY